MATTLSQESLRSIQKIMNKILWMKKNSEDITIPGRHMIALNRTKAPVKVGDLKIRGTILKAECLLYANSGIRHLRRYFDGNAPRIIEEYLRELLVDDLLTMGSQKMIAGKKNQRP